jgi:hypothetical protein
MNRTRAAIRTARTLLAKGLLGTDLQVGIREAHPSLTAKEFA